MSFVSTFQQVITAAPAWSKRHRVALGIVTGLLLVYALLGFFWLPNFARNAAIRYVDTHLHRRLSIGELTFNPFTLTARVRKVRLSEADGALLGSIDELLVNAELSSVFYRAYTFKQVRVVVPVINAIINADGSVNLAKLKPASTAASNTSDSALPAVRIGSLELERGELRFTDRSRPEEPFTTTLKPIRFTLQNFRTKPNYGNAFHFDATSQAGEYFDWQGEFTVQPVATRGRFAVRKLRADTIQDYLQDALPFRLLSGQVSLQGDYEFALSDKPDMQLQLSSIAVTDARIAPHDIAASATQSSSAKTVNDAAWVTLPLLNINDLHLSLQQRSIGIKQLRAEHATLQAWLDEQRNLNLLALRGPSKESSGPPWTIGIDTIAVDGATVQMEDRGVKPAAQFTLQPVTLAVQRYSTAPGATIDLNASIGIVNRTEPAAQLHTQGTVKLDDLTTELTTQVEQFELPALQSYVAQATDVIINSGRADATGRVHFRAASQDGKRPMTLKFDGDATVSDFNTQDNVEHNDFIKWRQLQLKDLSFGLNPDQLTIAAVTAHQPYGRVIINADTTTNLQQILRLKKQAPPGNDQTDDKQTRKPQPKAEPSMRIRVAKVTIDNGSANFADFTVKPSFASGIQALYGTVSNVSSASNSRAKVDLKGQVDNYSPVSISGEANFLAADTYSNVAMNFRNIDLTIFNPYSGKFAGYSIAKGKLSTELRYQISDRKIDLQHHIVIDQLEFGDATESKDKVPLPVKLAAALLKDRNGVIDLNLPVSGSLDDPQFRLGPVIWQAVKGLLSRIATSPFRALGALFGRGEELAFVDFKPGSAELDGDQHDKLDKLAKALVERPQLRLDVPLTTASDVDAAALNRAALEQAIITAMPKAATSALTPAQRLNALTALYKKQFNAEPDFNALNGAAKQDAPGDNKTDVTTQRIATLEQQLMPFFAISAADRDALTRLRANVVQSTLLTNAELSPERIFMTMRPHEVQSPDGVVRMELKLE